MSDETVAGVYKKKFEVERILDHHAMPGTLFVLVKWVGYDNPADLTWEPMEHMTHCHRKLVEYQRQLRPFSVVPPPDPPKRSEE
jgi:chromobox protein 1